MTEAMAAAPSNPKRLALVGPSAVALLRLREGLIREATARGHKVLCVAPDAAGELTRPRFDAMGAEPRAVDLNPSGLSFLADRKAEAELAQALSAWRPDAVLGFGGRSMALAALAARRAKVPLVVSLVNMLAVKGHPLPESQSLSNRRMRGALAVSDTIVVHNADHARTLSEGRLLPSGRPVVQVAGAGVDLERYQPLPLPPLNAGLVFLMIARLTRSRGVADYAEAARRVKERAPGATFLLAGPPGEGADAVPAQDLGAAIDYLGTIEDVRPALARCHVFVYPSLGEGMPRSVLEALACARPLVVTSAPGCRDTVDERVNGCLVTPGDPRSLAAGIESFLKRPDLIVAMSRASRVKAERRFDIRDVNRVLLDVLRLA